MTRHARHAAAIRRRAERCRGRSDLPKLIQQRLDRSIACRDRFTQALRGAQSDTADLTDFRASGRAFQRAVGDLLVLL
jgi:hypothetical protein